MSENSLAIRKFSELANPTRFLALTDRVLPWLAALTLLVFAAGLWLSFTTEGDYQQGETVRIMYVHVPSAWLSMMCYTVMAISALGTLVWRHPLADVSARAAAPIGACFTFLALVTGSLWASRCGAPGGSGCAADSSSCSSSLYLGLIALKPAPWRSRADRRASRRAISSVSSTSDHQVLGRMVEHRHQPLQASCASTADDRSGIPAALIVMAIAFTLLSSPCISPPCATRSGASRGLAQTPGARNAGREQLTP